MPGKENPTDWNSRHPESIDGWSENLRRKHLVDRGEEIRLNRVYAVRQLGEYLEKAGIAGGSRVAEKEIEEAGLRDTDYNKTRQQVAEGKQHQVKGEYKRVAR